MKKREITKRKKLVICMMTAAGLFYGIAMGNICDKQQTRAEASVMQIYNDYDKKVESAEVDLDGDGEKESVAVSEVGLSDGYSTRIIIKINGKTAFRSEKLYDDLYTEVSYIKLSSGDLFLWLCASGANDDPQIDTIYQYDKSSGQLKKALELDSILGRKGADHIYTSITTKDNTLRVKYSGQMIAAGYVGFTYIYQYEDGKFTLKPDTAKITSKWHKGDFTAKKKITFYKKAGSKKVSFRIKKGTTVQLKKVKLYKNAYYLQFTYGKKTGWIYAGQFDLFKGVQLAG